MFYNLTVLLLLFSGIGTARITVVTYGLLRHPASKFVREALYNQNFKVLLNLYTRVSYLLWFLTVNDIFIAISQCIFFLKKERKVIYF